MLFSLDPTIPGDNVIVATVRGLRKVSTEEIASMEPGVGANDAIPITLLQPNSPGAVLAGPMVGLAQFVPDTDIFSVQAILTAPNLNVTVLRFLIDFSHSIGN